MVALRAPRTAPLLRLLLLLCYLHASLSFSLCPATTYLDPPRREIGRLPITTKMNDELREIRRRQRERWLAAQAQGQGQGGEDGAPAAASSTNGGEAVENDASGGAGSAKSDANTQANAAGAGTTSKKRARPVAAADATNTNARNVVDLTFDDSDTDGVEDVGQKKKAKSDAGDDVDSDSSSDVEIMSPPIKRKQNRDAQYVQTSSIGSTSNNAGPMPNFSVASYNIWFGQTARGDPHPERRMEAISSIISDLQPRPLMVGMQEVTSELEQLLYPLLQSMGYHVISQPRHTRGQYYVAIAVLTGNMLGGGSSNGNDANDDTVSAHVVSSGFESYAETIMERGLLWTHVRLCSGTSSREVLFSTTHLESYLTGGFMGRPYDGVAQRKSQIRQAARFCREYAQTRVRHGTRIDAGIITGDLNWDDERKRSKGNDEKMLEVIDTDETWTDAWLKCRPGEDGYTYDAKLNDMLRGNLRRRFDRCLVWNGEGGNGGTDSGGIVPIQCDMIGTAAIAGLTYRKEKQKFSYGSFIPTGEFIDQPVSPSDHFGLYVTLEC